MHRARALAWCITNVADFSQAADLAPKSEARNPPNSGIARKELDCAYTSAELARWGDDFAPVQNHPLHRTSSVGARTQPTGGRASALLAQRSRSRTGGAARRHRNRNLRLETMAAHPHHRVDLPDTPLRCSARPPRSLRFHGQRLLLRSGLGFADTPRVGDVWLRPTAALRFA